MTDMGMFGKLVRRVAPGLAASRAESRIRLRQAERAEAVQLAMFPNIGQSVGDSPYTGASKKRSLASWFTSSGDADSDLLEALPVLRDRSQDQFRNTPAGRGVIKRIVTGAVGPGLAMRATVDHELLGLDKDTARKWNEAAEREFKLWSDSRECDFARRMTFNEIQMLAYQSQKVRGDCFVIMTWIPRKGVPYDLRLQLIEADRISNPNMMPDDEKIAGGIEKDVDGVPAAIHVQNVHPGNRYVNVVPKWKRVPIFGEKTGRRQVLHLMEFERIDQSRGEVVLAPIIETLKQLSRYSVAEMSAAVINAILAVFIKRPIEGETPSGQVVDYTDEEREAWKNRNLNLGAGTWIEGAPGEELQTVTANRPSAQFEPFFAACLKQIGMALGVPYEVLMQYFQSSYSASRAAILEFVKNMRVARAWFKNNLCQQVYEEFLTEAVVKGRLDAPGFLADPIMRRLLPRRMGWAERGTDRPAEGSGRSHQARLVLHFVRTGSGGNRRFRLRASGCQARRGAGTFTFAGTADSSGSRERNVSIRSGSDAGTERGRGE